MTADRLNRKGVTMSQAIRNSLTEGHIVVEDKHGREFIVGFNEHGPVSGEHGVTWTVCHQDEDADESELESGACWDESSDEAWAEAIGDVLESVEGWPIS